MERVQNISVFFLLVWFCSCNLEQTPFPSPSSFHGEILSRGINDSQSLPTGSQILLSASGGLQIDREIFTYNGNRWEGENSFEWTNPQEETNITAFYPVYDGKQYTSHQLYAHNQLEDVLIAQSTLGKKEVINLQFRHLFSLLTIHLAPALLENLTEVRLTTPSQVSKIHDDGTFTLTAESFTGSLPYNGTSDYRFIIPPQEESILTLSLVMNDHTVCTTPFQPHTFSSGMKYECNVHPAETSSGIRTAEDLIIFSQIINETYKGSKSWTDFGEEINGKRVFYLLNDIALTEEDCQRLSPIGDHFRTPFTDTFDGKGHTISNLQFKAYNGYGGLFSIIEETGAVKNLHIDKVSGPVAEGGYKSGIGFLAGACYGEISNCHVTNGTLSTNEFTNVGGIVGTTTGRIVNSSVAYSKLTAPEGSLGGIAGTLGNAQIINCCTYRNTISGKSNQRGGIAGYISNSTLTNNYVYKNSFDTYSTGKGIMVGQASQSTISYCYYDKTPLVKDISGSTSLENYVFTTSFTATAANIPVYQLLNQWITGEGFIGWKASPDLPAVFDY